MSNYENLENLANAIVLQSYEDYVTGKKLLLDKFPKFIDNPEKISKLIWESGRNRTYRYKAKEVRKRNKRGRYLSILKTYMDADNFIGGEWYTALTKVDPSYLRGLADSEVGISSRKNPSIL